MTSPRRSITTPEGSPVTREAALRIALAARTLPDVKTAAFVHALGERLGLPITADKLSRITVADIKAMLQGDSGGELIVDPGVAAATLKAAVRYLWGEGLDDGAPVPDAILPQGVAALRVAVASNNGEQLDGHFGSCLRFLVYLVTEDSMALAEVRPTRATDEAPDRNVARAALIADCHIACLQSIGGPAAAKLVRAGVHPVKYPVGGPARKLLGELQGTLRRPPPWLARLLGRDAETLRRFAGDAASPA